MKRKVTFVTCLLTLLLAGCASAPEPYAVTYHQALDQAEASDNKPHAQPQVGEAQLRAFANLFTNLQGPGLRERISGVYATQLYFNDTVHTLTSRDQVADYLEETAERADLIEVRIDDSVMNGRDAYVRWTMRTVFTVSGKEKDIVTVGMTHLRFDEQGLVTLHQDFWDSTEGLYRHMPVVGGVINWIGTKL